jgi:hypothetical protein
MTGDHGEILRTIYAAETVGRAQPQECCAVSDADDAGTARVL